MSRRSRFSPELKIEIVSKISKILAGNRSVAQAARAISADESSVKRWIAAYRERGVDGLSDCRGKRKSLDEMTEVERLPAELKLKEAEVKRLYFENPILKKVRELQRGRELEHLEHVNNISSK